MPRRTRSRSKRKVSRKTKKVKRSTRKVSRKTKRKQRGGGTFNVNDSYVNENTFIVKGNGGEKMYIKVDKSGEKDSFNVRILPEEEVEQMRADTERKDMAMIKGSLPPRPPPPRPPPVLEKHGTDGSDASVKSLAVSDLSSGPGSGSGSGSGSESEWV